MHTFTPKHTPNRHAPASMPRRQVLASILCCALLSLGCGTWSLSTEIARTDDGKHQVALDMGIEIDKEVWRALQDMEGGSSAPMTSGLEEQGWNVTTLEDGRVTNARKELLPIERLAEQGWTVSVEPRPTGRVVTATLDVAKLLSSDTSSMDSTIKSFLIVIDETDPDAPQYTFLSTVEIPPYEPVSDEEGASCVPDENSLAGFFCAISQSIKDDPKQKALMEALKNAGPPKVVLGFTLPGIIEEATVNGSPSGELLGDTRNQVRWTLPADRPGTYNLRAFGVAGATIKLDRTEAARFGAIRIKGRGFKPKTHVNIKMNDVEIFRISETLPNGTFPEDTWIWVPDDAPFGVNKVWAEEGGSEVKSNKVDLAVKEISMAKLIENLDAVLQPYMDNPRLVNENWHGKLKSGAFRNIMNAGGTIVGGTAWLVTTVFTLGYYQADLWPDNTYVCSWYQAEVLEYLHKLRFHPDPAARAVLDGLDYGPFNSGLVDIAPGSHFFVVLWPHGPALNPAAAASINPSWSSAGIALDPWPRQAPGLFELKSGTAAWAESSIYSARWKIGTQYTYLQPRPEPKNFGYHKNDYPVMGTPYYNPKSSGKLAVDYRKIAGSGNEPSKSLSVKSPVTLEIRDAQGRRAGMHPDGELFNEIPDSEILVVPKSEGGYEWYVALPEGALDVTITGTDTGTFQLVTKQAGQPIQEYPRAAVTKGAAFTLAFHDESSPNPLRPEQGEELFPTARPASQLETPQNPLAPLASFRLDSRLLPWLGGGALLLGVILLVVMAGRRSRRKAMTANVPPSSIPRSEPGLGWERPMPRPVDLPEQGPSIRPARSFPSDMPEARRDGAGVNQPAETACPRCGAQRRGRARFCSVCGNAFQ